MHSQPHQLSTFALTLFRHETTIDGAPVPVLRVNNAIRAVMAPAGDHSLVWTYRPRFLFPLLALLALGDRPQRLDVDAVLLLVAVLVLDHDGLLLRRSLLGSTQGIGELAIVECVEFRL